MGHPSCLQLWKKKAAGVPSCIVSSNVHFYFNYGLKATASPEAARQWGKGGGGGGGVLEAVFQKREQQKQSPPAAPNDIEAGYI